MEPNFKLILKELAQLNRRFDEQDASLNQRFADLEHSLSERSAAVDSCFDDMVASQATATVSARRYIKDEHDDHVAMLKSATTELCAWQPGVDGVLNDIQISMQKLAKSLDRAVFDEIPHGSGVFNTPTKVAAHSSARFPVDQHVVGHHVEPTTHDTRSRVVTTWIPIPAKGTSFNSHPVHPIFPASCSREAHPHLAVVPTSFHHSRSSTGSSPFYMAVFLSFRFSCSMEIIHGGGAHAAKNLRYVRSRSIPLDQSGRALDGRGCCSLVLVCLRSCPWPLENPSVA
ncbi:unnamed protein product [Miscanthus lutarioriparius]|uniref:Uncharacterized protein n=1 Tax=Miscanthus lutarioriparius TaxID=422564 RepID=A0A811QTL5_9POAL|nr:unnamed protein product [Miscanthus lutarioriparius]